MKALLDKYKPILGIKGENLPWRRVYYEIGLVGMHVSFVLHTHWQALDADEYQTLAGNKGIDSRPLRSIGLASQCRPAQLRRSGVHSGRLEAN